MPVVKFTQNLQRHLSAPPTEVEGTTVHGALEQVFLQSPQVRSYVLDDQGRLRKHVVIFVDNELIEDRIRLSDEVGTSSEILVMQALSGG
jgi:molybdopterin synthase sulfur carrier subunit